MQHCVGPNLQHNGISYCVETASRLFQANREDGSRWWSFVLPGQNQSNAVVDIIGVDNQIALIADRNPASIASPLQIQNDRFEMSLFNSNGGFVATYDLLPLPGRDGQYAAMCGIDDSPNNQCTPHLASFHVSVDSDSGEWRWLESISFASNSLSDTVNASRVPALIANLSEFASRQYMGDHLGKILQFNDSIEPLRMPLADPTQEEVTQASTSIPVDLQSAISAERASLYVCPDSGTVLGQNVSQGVTTSLSSYTQCSSNGMSVNGTLTRGVVHRSSNRRFEQLSYSENGVTVLLNGGYNGTFGYPNVTGRFGSSIFERTNSFGTLTVLNLDSTWQEYTGNSSFVGLHGASAVLSDGRTGRLQATGSSSSRRTLSYSFTDPAMDYQQINVWADIAQSSDYFSFLIDGSEERITNQIATLTGLGRHSITLRERGANDNWEEGSVLMRADDGSLLEIITNGWSGSPLGELKIFSAQDSSLVLRTYVDLQAIFAIN